MLALHPDITITIDAPSEALILSVDGPLIELAIMNLFENAVKYSSTTAKISVKIREDQDNTIIDISDQGIGIGKKELDHIFDRFYTVNKAQARKMGGAGLGLSIVRNIVEKHGGELSAQSTIGTGTTFTLTLPHAEITALV
ncbi:MAG: cell wall metabolism sensor histidine kinase WalK [Pseudomonadales bacterium]|nr:cell wall metabolism sensor histidine kinase WalK [Pseudomonadales bacterium]